MHVLIWYCSACCTRDVHVLRACCASEPVQTGSNQFKLEKKPRKKCTVSSSDRLYKPIRYCNCHHNRSPISTVHFDSTPKPRSNTSRCRDGSGTPSFASIYYILSLFVRMLTNNRNHNRSPIFAHLFRRITNNDEIHMFKMQQSCWKKHHMLRHERTVCNSTTTTVSPPSVCKKCGKVFANHHTLQRHERTVCVDSPPLPKRPKKEDTTSRHPFISEDPIDPPERFPFPDALSTDLLEVVCNNWSSIRTRVSRGPLQTGVNFRLCSLDTTTLETPLKTMFEQQTNAFKINLSYGFVLKNKNTGCYRYYHSSCNCCGRYLDEPSLITNLDELMFFLNV